MIRIHVVSNAELGVLLLLLLFREEDAVASGIVTVAIGPPLGAAVTSVVVTEAKY